MISSDQRHSVGVAYFDGQQEKERFHRIESSVHKVTHKEIVGFRDFSTDSEEFHEVKELAMDVTADSDGRVNVLDVAFLNQDFTGFCTKNFYLKRTKL